MENPRGSDEPAPLPLPARAQVLLIIFTVNSLHRVSLTPTLCFNGRLLSPRSVYYRVDTQVGHRFLIF